jgi:WD40 repeat protein
MTPANDDAPYKGLWPYSEADAGRFFGRDVETRVAAENLQASRLTVLYGQSGAGKSSLLRAGVMPYLSRESRRNREFNTILIQDWRTDPVSQLRQAAGANGSGTVAEALARGSAEFGSEVLLIFDQFEDFFQYPGDRSDENGLFVQIPRLLGARDVEVHLLIGIREDALALLDGFKARIPSIFDNVLRLNHLSRAAAFDAMTRPLEGTPWTLAPDIADSVLDDIVRTQPGSEGGIQGPYLQLVMRRWWERAKQRESTELTRQILEDDLGGVRKIFETYFDERIAALPAAARREAVRIFVPLTTQTGRKIAQTVSEVAAASKVSRPKVRQTLEELRLARILTTTPPPAGMSPGDTAYEFAHDLLARRALEWRRAEELREARRRAVLYTIAAVLLTLAIVWAILLWNRSVKTEVLIRSTIAHARDNLNRDPELSILLASYAVDRTRRENSQLAMDAQEVLSRAILANPLLEVLPTASGFVYGVDWNRSGKTIAIGDYDGNVRIVDVNSGKLIESFPGQAVHQLHWAPRGDVLAVATANRTLRWIRPATKQDLVYDSGERTITVGRSDLSWCRDGMHVAGAFGTRVVLWGPPGTEPKIWNPGSSIVSAVDVTPDCKTVAIADGYNIALWNPETNETKRFVAHLPRVYNRTTNETDGTVCLRWDPSGQLLASAGSDGLAAIWSLGSGSTLPTCDTTPRYIGGHFGRIDSIAWSADGERLATGGVDGTARIWDTSTGRSLGALFTRQQRVFTVAWSPGGSELATSGEDANVKIWNTVQFTRPQTVTLMGHSGEVLWTSKRYRRGEDPVGRIRWFDGTYEENSEVISHDLTVPELLDLARQRISRPLMKEECVKYLATTSCPAVAP